MSWRLFSLFVVGSAVCSSAAAFAADAAIASISRQVVVEQPASCLRWVWQQYSWYDDCWASRYPYIAGRVAVRGAWRR